MRVVEKRQLKTDAEIIAMRDEMMNTLIKYAKEEIQGERGVIGHEIKFKDGQVKRGKKIYDYEIDRAIPGQPPKNRTGNLRRSIKGQKYRKGFGDYRAIVGPTIVYGRAVEVANEYAPPTWSGDTRAKGFPYMKPAYKKFRLVYAGIVRKHLLKG